MEFDATSSQDRVFDGIHDHSVPSHIQDSSSILPTRSGGQPEQIFQSSSLTKRVFDNSFYDLAYRPVTLHVMAENHHDLSRHLAFPQVKCRVVGVDLLIAQAAGEAHEAIFLNEALQRRVLIDKCLQRFWVSRLLLRLVCNAT